MHKITLIPGDGVGPELIEVTKNVLEATGVQFDWDVQEAGEDVYRIEGTPLPQRVVDSIKKNKVALKGPVTTPVGKGFRSVNVTLRQELDLFCCLRPCKTFKGINTKYDRVDLVIVRENTEDLYAGIEFERGARETSELIDLVYSRTGKLIRSDSSISLKPIS
ncbi:MAG: isocitrate/isopropylmalate family dehydrogenase, partial [Thermodesulfovibrionales bacterium]|nr:isocitrate/isopropylmalate family dehydrogenase [Thermodesulfovibrionales bacterium]